MKGSDKALWSTWLRRTTDREEHGRYGGYSLPGYGDHYEAVCAKRVPHHQEGHREAWKHSSALWLWELGCVVEKQARMAELFFANCCLTLPASSCQNRSDCGSQRRNSSGREGRRRGRDGARKKKRRQDSSSAKGMSKQWIERRDDQIKVDVEEMDEVGVQKRTRTKVGSGSRWRARRGPFCCQQRDQLGHYPGKTGPLDPSGPRPPPPIQTHPIFPHPLDAQLTSG